MHNRHARKTNHLLNNKSVLLALALIASAFLLLSQAIQTAYGNSLGLENLPTPFVSSNKLMNCTAVVASSLRTPGLTPCGNAHTMDVMGIIMVSAKFGLQTDNGTLETIMDDSISSYNSTSIKVTMNDVSSNLVVVGGPGVNQVTWYYNYLKYPNGSRMLPVYFDKFANGTDYIYVIRTNHYYKIQFDGLGRMKEDYGIIETFDDHGRHVLLLAGLGGSGTWACCDVMSTYDSWGLHGGAAIVKYNDTNNDGFLDKIWIVESVSTNINLSSLVVPIPLALFAATIVPKLKTIGKKLLRKRLLVEAFAILMCVTAAQISLIVFSGPESELFTFKDFSHPFVASGGLLNCTAIVASSLRTPGLTPCGNAHTMDVMGGVMVAAQFGEDATGGSLGSTLDDIISSYNSSTGQITFSPVTTNLLAVGGPGVNQVTWYYNNLRNGSGDRVLPAYFDKFPNGTDYIQVPSSGHQYTIQYDGLGRISADYGVATLYYDSNHGWWVVIAAGLGGLATEAASRLLATYTNWSVFGQAVIVKYYDANADGYLDTISVPEVVGVGKSIDLYWDAQCKNAVQSIDWGTLVAGNTGNVTVYIRNEGAENTILDLNVSGWSPLQAASYMNIDWNYSGTPVPSGTIVPIMLVLTVDQDIYNITDFGVNITISSS